MCVRARVSSGAPGFCLSHNVTLEEEAGRESCTFLTPTPLRLSASHQLPPPPAQPPAVICITKARRSWEEKGRGVRLSLGPAATELQL